MSAKRYQRVCQVLARRQPDLTVVMENVHKPHNLAAIARSADAVGAMGLHATSRDEHIALTQKASSGSNKWVELTLHANLGAAFELLHGQGFQTLAMTLDEHAVDYRQIDYTRPTAFIVGEELDGLTNAAISGASHSVYVPMLGMVESLNVSVATALVLFEAKRQREVAGLYDTPRLDDETYNRLRFEWCQPVIAEYCQRHGLAYPPIDEEGDVIGSINP